jgi:hypothetical protein
MNIINPTTTDNKEDDIMKIACDYCEKIIIKCNINKYLDIVDKKAKIICEACEAERQRIWFDNLGNKNKK